MKQTPAEQARELVDKFLPLVECGDNRHTTTIQLKNAKQCALIANNKELESAMWLNILCNSDNYMKQFLNDKVTELMQIETEIEKL